MGAPGAAGGSGAAGASGVSGNPGIQGISGARLYTCHTRQCATYVQHICTITPDVCSMCVYTYMRKRAPWRFETWHMAGARVMYVVCVCIHGRCSRDVCSMCVYTWQVLACRHISILNVCVVCCMYICTHIQNNT